MARHRGQADTYLDPYIEAQEPGHHYEEGPLHQAVKDPGAKAYPLVYLGHQVGGSHVTATKLADVYPLQDPCHDVGRGYGAYQIGSHYRQFRFDYLGTGHLKLYLAFN